MAQHGQCEKKVVDVKVTSEPAPPPTSQHNAQPVSSGLKISYPSPPAPPCRADMGYEDGLSMEEAIAKYRESGARW
eukprot:435426-Prorocentrum_minimum.AAC.1